MCGNTRMLFVVQALLDLGAMTHIEGSPLFGGEHHLLYQWQLSAAEYAAFLPQSRGEAVDDVGDDMPALAARPRSASSSGSRTLHEGRHGDNDRGGKGESWFCVECIG